MMAAMYLTLRGTPILYYGEEIGMENNDPKRKEEVQDPQGRRGWPKEKGATENKADAMERRQ